jgi:hypothetical protein
VSVRLCYLERASRGGVLRSIRLIGQSSEERWNTGDAPRAAGHASAIEEGAAWVAERLGQTRAAGALEMVCLVVDGGVCAWVSSPSRDETAVAAVARMGPTRGLDDAGFAAESTGSGGASAITFFAGNPLDSSVQALVEEEVEDSGGGAGLLALVKGRKKKSAVVVERLPVLATVDVPARLFIDALDRLGVRVVSACSLWHALAMAWDASSDVAGASAEDTSESESVAATDAPATAIVLIDPIGRLVWSWSRAGKLVAGGSMRLRVGGPTGEGVSYGRAEVARLSTEWLGWSLQTGFSARRVVCVVPDASATGNPQASEFGEALGAAWAGATVDLAVHDDPVGATFARIAKGLEGTAAPVGATEPTRGLTTLAARPGRANRKLWLWSALVMTAASALLGVIAWQWKREAVDLERTAEGYRIKWRDEAGKVYPDALTLAAAGAGGPIMSLKTEVERRRAELMPVSPEDSMPILQELETISLVVGAGDFTLERLDVGSDLVRVVVVVKDTASAEALQMAMRRIEGSHVEWSEQMIDVKGPDGKSGSVRVSFDGTWIRRKDGMREGGGS